MYCMFYNTYYLLNTLVKNKIVGFLFIFRQCKIIEKNILVLVEKHLKHRLTEKIFERHSKL